MKKPGAKVFVIYNKKLLLILRDNNPAIPSPNTWNLPGGGIEENESSDQAVKRELQEEINIIPKDLTYLGRQVYEDGSVVERYLAKLTEKEFLDIKLGDEGQKLSFFSADDLLHQELSGYLKEYCTKYISQIKELVQEDSVLPPELLGLTKD